MENKGLYNRNGHPNGLITINFSNLLGFTKVLTSSQPTNIIVSWILFYNYSFTYTIFTVDYKKSKQ